MNDLDSNTLATDTLQCDGCGAPLVYKPGTTSLVCEHCGNTKSIDQTKTEIKESNFNEYIKDFKEEDLGTTKVITCSNCEATPTVDENLKSMLCPYCGSPLVEKNAHQERYIKPGYIIPFNIDKNQVNNLLSKWIKSLWFAPNKIKRAVISPLNLNGIYMPFWTFDALVITDYVGKRGTIYEVEVGSGENKRRQQRIRWSYTSGRIEKNYDDVLVNGSKTLEPKIISKIAFWNTHNILKINNSYLSGFITEKYQIDLKLAFTYAKDKIEKEERERVRRDIGGDKQQIDKMNTEYYDVTFKHVLLPIYVSSFRYKNKLYTFYVNGSTGKIAGKRPYSIWKIAFATIIAIIVLIMMHYYISSN